MSVLTAPAGTPMVAGTGPANAGAPATQGGQNVRRPSFRSVAARHRISQRYVAAFTSGAPIYVQLSPNGLLAKHRINVNGTVTVGTTGTVTDSDQINAFFDRINLRSPQGTAIPAMRSGRRGRPARKR